MSQAVRNVTAVSSTAPVSAVSAVADRCPTCVEQRQGLCGECWALLRRAPNLAAPTACDVCRSLLAYEGPARRLVAGLKYRNDRVALGWLADGMAGLLVPPPGTVVTWVPTTGVRRRRRGFDQAELLARAVARRWRLPCRQLLVRRAGPAQTGRSLSDRLAGVALAVRPGRRVPAAVVVVDDVTTTGATLRSAALALRAGGATRLAVVTAAATPRRV